MGDLVVVNWNELCLHLSSNRSTAVYFLSKKFSMSEEWLMSFEDKNTSKLFLEVDDHQEIKKRLKISVIPTVLFFSFTKEIARITGFADKNPIVHHLSNTKR